MATSNDMELVRKAIKLLHSSHQDSATELRMMLDEAIKQRYGPEKMLSNTLSKRHLDEEKTFPGRAATPTPEQQQQPDADEVINLTNSPAKTISDSPNTIVDSEDGGGAGVSGTMLTAADDDVNFNDLNCCVCGVMVFTATNRLIECSKCGTLYHQECHKPAITDEETSEDQEHNWQCDSCANKPSTSKAAGVVVIPDEPIALVAAVTTTVAKTKSSATSSRSSSSSNSSSSFAANFQAEQPVAAAATATAAAAAATAPVTSSRHHHKSSRSHREERPSSSSSKSSSSALNPTINIISAPDKSSHSSKRSSSHSSSSKSSSSKSSSRHHESSSSSSKRKSSK